MLIIKTLKLLPAQLLSPLAQFASILIWTHIASSETIGVVTLVSGQQELIRTILLAWWSQYALRFIGEAQGNGKIFQSTSNSILLFSALAQGIASVILLHFFVVSEPEFLLILSVMLFVVLRCINQHNVNIAAARSQTLDYNILSIVGPVLGLGIGAFLLFLLGDNPAYPLLGYALGESIGLIYSLARSQSGWVGWQIDYSILKQAYSYSLPLIISGALAWSAGNLSRYIIDHELGVAAAGDFAVGFGLGQRAAALAAMLVTAAGLPLAIRRMQESGTHAAMQQLADNCALLLATMLPCLVGLYLVSPDLVQLVVSKKFHKVTLDILPWALLSGGLYSFIYNYLNHYFLVTKNTRPLIMVDGSLAMITLGLSFPLIHSLGLVGGVIAMVLAASFVVLVLMAYLLGRCELCFPLKDALKIIIATVVMAGAILIKPECINLKINLGGNILIGIIVYAATLALGYRSRLHHYFSHKN
jgi:O-antigen/teichoic acid export membrane protein